MINKNSRKTITSIILLVSLAIFSVGGIGYYFLQTLKDALLESRKHEVKNMVDSAYALAQRYYKLSQNGMSEEEAKKLAIESIRSMRFDGSNYFWINDATLPYPIMLLHPAIPALEGKVMDNPIFNCATTIQYGDSGKMEELSKNISLFHAFAKVCEVSKSGFVGYDWPKPKSDNSTTKELYPKISYVKKLDGWNWIIGSGVYIEDVNDTYKKAAFQVIVSVAITILAYYFISMFFLKRISKYDAELRELNKNLERRVQIEVERSRQKDSILIQQSKLAAMGEMIGNIAHQWRQPLNALAITIQDIPEALRFGELTDEYAKKFINESMAMINYMSKTIDDFRNFFKPSKEKSVFDVKEQITQAYALIKGSLDACSINVTITAPEYELPSYGYSNEFSQVILNILNNSKDALSTAEQERKNIFISVINEDKFIKIIIEDNAGGVPIQIIDKIFEPYFTTKHKSQGTGLGLYMSKMIIEQNMDGFLKVSNTEQGARFEIDLPTDITRFCKKKRNDTL